MTETRPEPPRHRADDPRPEAAPDEGSGWRDALVRLKTLDPLGRLRLAFYVGIALAVVVVAAVAAIGVYVLSVGSDVADLTSTEAVAANRVKASAEVRGYPGMPCPDPMAYNADTLTLECANRFVVAVGGEPVPDPGEAATPTQMGAALARALGRFDRALERTGMTPDSGVVAPDQGRFRGGQ